MAENAEQDASFTEFVVGRRAQLYRTAYLLTGDHGRAEDIVQTSLSKLYVVWPRISRFGAVEAYARRIVVNAHLDDVRRPWWRERPSSYEQLDRAAPDRLGVEESDALWSALRQLAPGQRRVVVLRHYWGLSVDETAADLGVSPGTVKSQTAAALAHLRSALTPTASSSSRPVGDQRSGE